MTGKEAEDGDWRDSPWILLVVISFLTLSLVPAFAGEQPKSPLSFIRAGRCRAR